MKPTLPRGNVLLGLAFDGPRVEALVVRRAASGAECGAGAAFALSADLASGDPAALGAELRAKLSEAGISERRCVVALPIDWAMTLATPLPDLAPEDAEDLLQLEAERGFPFAPESLGIARLPYGSGAGSTGALQVAVAADRVARAEQVLRAAKLVPASFTLAFPALASASAGSADHAVTVAVGETGVAVAIGSGRGFAVLRNLGGVLEASDGQSFARADAVARELRVTLGQIDPGLRGRIERVRVVGTGAAADRLASDLAPRAVALGLVVERVTAANPQGLGLAVPAGRALSAPLVVAARRLAGLGTELEFLPPRVSAWRQFSSRHSSKNLAYAGVAAGIALLAVAGLFGWQQFRLSALESEWKAMEKEVGEVARVDGQIRRFRSWYDESFRSLGILKRLTESFPEDSSVTAKNIEFREAGLVVCSGTARDNASLLRTLDKLRSAQGVTEVQVEQVRGKSPQQFTFNFRWDPSAPQP